MRFISILALSVEWARSIVLQEVISMQPISGAVSVTCQLCLIGESDVMGKQMKRVSSVHLLESSVAALSASLAKSTMRRAACIRDNVGCCYQRDQLGPKTIKKSTNSTPNKCQTQRLVLT